MKKTASLLGLACLFILMNGCRNPFLPSSDVFLSSVEGPNGGEVTVYAAESGSTSFSVVNYRSTARFVVRNKVGINITSLTMVFTDISGNQVTEYSKSGGKSFKMNARLYPVLTNSEFGSTGEGHSSSVEFYPVDRRVITELATVSSNTINCLLVFRGEDDTGHDVRLSASITIKGYGF